MATSGSFNTSAYSNRYLKFSWSVQSQSVASNTTTISWSLTGAGSASGYYKAGNFKVVINGSTVYSTSQNDRINLYNGTQVASGTFTIAHNSDGTKSFTASAQAGIYTYAVNCTGSGTFTLPTIARASIINSVTGSRITDTFSVNTTKYSTAFTNTLQIAVGGTVYQSIGNYVSGTSFTLSNALKTAIYNATPTSKTVTLGFSLVTYNGSTVVGTSATTNVTVTINNSNPTIGGVTYLDSNNTTVAITGNNQYIIRNKSNLQVTVTNLTAINGATLSNVKVTFAGVPQTVILSGTTDASEVINFGTVNISSNGTLTVTLTDSRGFSTTTTVTVLVYDWIAPSAVISCQRQDNFYSATDLLVNSTISSIGGKNAVTITAYTKLASASTYGSAISITDGVTSTLTLDNTQAWNVKIVVADKLGSTPYILFIDRGQPIIFFDRLLSSVGINCFPAQNESLEANGLRLDDKIYIGSQSIYDYYETSTSGESVLTTAYDYRLIENVFAGIAIPTNYVKAYKITFQYTTANNNVVKVRLNNISSNNCNTWSSDKFRSIGGTRLFKESELVLETCSGYSRNGLNLYVSNSGAYTAKLWNITIHGYLVNVNTNLDVSTFNVPDVTPEQA